MLITSPNVWAAQLATADLPPLRSNMPADKEFRGRMVNGHLGPVQLAGFETPPGDCIRDPEILRPEDQQLCQVDLILAGEVQVEHEGRNSRLNPGDFVVTDPSRPVRIRSTRSSHLSVLIPRTMLEHRTRDLGNAAGKRLSGAHGSGALLIPLVQAAVRSIDTFTEPEASRTASVLADVLSSALTGQLENQSTPEEVLRVRVRAYIDAQLPEPGLNPASVAAAHHISLSRLHKLFRDQPHTVAALIRRRRLEKCRSELVRAGAGVAAVGARWGFTDPAHFSRAFKAAYGTSPRDFRDLHADGGRMSKQLGTHRHGGAG
ncbi:AraC-like ligand-binding domain-containing protein [Kineosporia babensis]|uniref:Helix-turn-helix domain-containing protein n=1 Tax=Kineosporia babensis TaxID=499548 RepID=A0A9X1NDY4_9ACTN|nr:helix-turn-helix domain-containing protein [Kineosporia babensis]MCD5311986.1 helix-turn-helix domain-containing protein [Kineosporia babensis]